MERRFRVEGWQDHEERLGDCLRLVQLKDRKAFGPAEFADEVLRPFARQFAQMRRCDAEFALVASAELRGSFWGPFRAICHALSEQRRKAPSDRAVDLRRVLRSVGQKITVPRAAVWRRADALDGESRELPMCTACDFVAWVTRAALMQQAGLSDEDAVLELLSRTEVVDGRSFDALRYRCLSMIASRVAHGQEQLLDAAVGRLQRWAADGDVVWRSVDSLLAEMGLPALAVTWSALRARGPGAVAQRFPLTPDGDLPYRPRPVYEGLFTSFLLECPPQGRVFLLTSRGRESKTRLMRRFAQISSREAPTFAFDASEGSGAVERCLRELSGGAHCQAWPPDALLERLHSTRPPGVRGPSFVLLCDHFGDGHIESHQDLANTLSQHAGRYDGLLVLAGRRSEFDRVSGASFLRDVWRLASEHPHFARDTAWEPTIDMDRQPWYPAEQLPVEGPTDVLKHIEHACRRTMAEIRQSIGLLLDAAPRHQYSVVSAADVAGLPWWDWGSTKPEDFPQAAVCAGLFDRQADGSLSLFPSPTCAAVISDWMRYLPRERQTEIAQYLAEHMMSNWALVEGFALWFASVPQEASENSLAWEIHRVFACGRSPEPLEQIYSKQVADSMPLLWAIALERYRAEAADTNAHPLAKGHAVERVLQMIDATDAGASEKCHWALRTLTTSTDEPTMLATCHFCRALGGEMVDRALELLRALRAVPSPSAKWPSSWRTRSPRPRSIRCRRGGGWPACC